MINIKLPATTANLGVGFDCLGLSLNIHNEFSFVESKTNTLLGFEEKYSDSNNLVLHSYLAFAKKKLMTGNTKNVSIELIKNDIPVARGLGSSATCIIAGVLASNQINDINASYDECIKFAAKLEGHYDNVYACAYGGLIAVMKEDNSIYYQKLSVSDKLNFYILIPNVLGNTVELRDALPKLYTTEEVVYNLSRSFFVANAFKEGSIDFLKVVLKDKLHEKYRYPTIPSNKEIEEMNKLDNVITLISGSGPSVLLISSLDSIELSKSITNHFKLIHVQLGNQTNWEVLL